LHVPPLAPPPHSFPARRSSDLDASDTLLLEQEYRLTFLLAENCHQHIGAGHFSLAGALHMEHGTLQYTLEAQRRLSLAVLIVLRSEEHTSELQSRENIVCRLLL